jgi:hypothetical protein
MYVGIHVCTCKWNEILTLTHICTYICTHWARKNRKQLQVRAQPDLTWVVQFLKHFYVLRQLASFAVNKPWIQIHYIQYKKNKTFSRKRIYWFAPNPPRKEIDEFWWNNFRLKFPVLWSKCGALKCLVKASFFRLSKCQSSASFLCRK